MVLRTERLGFESKTSCFLDSRDPMPARLLPDPKKSSGALRASPSGASSAKRGASRVTEKVTGSSRFARFEKVSALTFAEA